MDQRNDHDHDHDLVIKARFRFTGGGGGDGDEDGRDGAQNMYWNEMILSDDAKTPCYAFRRGNILFTTIPPPRQPPVQKSCTSTCKINVTDRSDKRHESDFCEVCCGIRSPSFSRRAHSFTTHFCTRVPAKKNVNFTNSSSDQRSKSTDSSVGSSVSSVNQSFGNLLSSRGHISRLSAYLKRRGQQPSYGEDSRYEEAASSDCTSETSSSCDRKSSNFQRRSGCDKCGLSSTNSTLATSRSSAVTEYSSYSSSYPSSCSSYMPFFLDNSCSSSVCCECSGRANSTFSSFNSLRSTVGSDRKKEQECEKARFFSNESSSDSDNETCSSEMGWSFGSFCQVDQSRSLSRATTMENVVKSDLTKKDAAKSIGKPVTPFVSSSNRKLVTEKFGDIVSSLRKPGHHVGPSKNADCLCDNCRSFFCKK